MKFLRGIKLGYNIVNMGDLLRILKKKLHSPLLIN